MVGAADVRTLDAVEPIRRTAFRRAIRRLRSSAPECAFFALRQAYRSVAPVVAHLSFLLTVPEMRRQTIGLLGQRLSWSVREWTGRRSVECSLCGWKGDRFRPHFNVGARTLREDALCPGCRALERHRSLGFFLNERLPKGRTAVVIDIGPIPALQERLQARPEISYVSVDLVSWNADAIMDAQRLGIADECADLVICCNVLDYVGDEPLALREISRVLKSGGFAVIQDSVGDAPATVEYGGPRGNDSYRVRRFGTDRRQRLSSAGLRVDEERFEFELAAETTRRFGIKPQVFWTLHK